MSALAEARGVTRRFGRTTAVDSVDLVVGAGDVVGLLGANGAGKTTLMRLILGLVRPTGGSVDLFGRPPERGTRRRIGYVPQGSGLYEDLTVAQNLEFVARGFGGDTSEVVDPEVRRTLSTLVADLPLGLRRRVAFAAALSHGPELLVLDEPTSGVDPLARARLWDRITSVAAAGTGVLVSTHNMEEAENCDRLVVMVDGRVAAEGTLEGIVGGRRVVEVSAVRWNVAFAALDAAGMQPSLGGRSLRVANVDAAEVVGALTGAGVQAEVREVPADLDEAFVALTRPA